MSSEDATFEASVSAGLRTPTKRHKSEPNEANSSPRIVVPTRALSTPVAPLEWPGKLVLFS